MFRFFSGLLILTFSLGGVGFLQMKQLEVLTAENKINYQKQREKEQLFLQVQKNMPRFGFNNLWADWNYLNFVQYFGDTPAREVTGYDLIPEYFQAVVQDDPRFVEALLMFSTANTLYAATPQTTVRLLNQALAALSPEIHPLTPYVWSYKGVDEMLFLGDMKAAQKSYETAAEWALQTNAQDKKAVAQRNRETADFLAKNPDSKKAKVAGWSFILSSGLNEETQKLAIREIISLGGKLSVTPEGLLKVDFPEED
jgi:hypothetical protein